MQLEQFFTPYRAAGFRTSILRCLCAFVFFRSILRPYLFLKLGGLAILGRMSCCMEFTCHTKCHAACHVKYHTKYHAACHVTCHTRCHASSHIATSHVTCQILSHVTCHTSCQRSCHMSCHMSCHGTFHLTLHMTPSLYPTPRIISHREKLFKPPGICAEKRRERNDISRGIFSIAFHRNALSLTFA
jgi:hypothetical protein